VYGYFVMYMLALGAYGILANADMVFVKRFFDEALAGRFAAAVMPARIVYFLPLPVAYAMFPKIVSSGLSSAPDMRILIKALFMVGFIEVVVAIIASVFPSVTLRLLVGSVNPELIHLMRLLVWAVSPLPLVFVLVNFELAQRRFSVILPLALSVAVYCIGICIWHSKLIQIAVSIGASTLLALAGSVFVVFFCRKNLFDGERKG